MDKEDKLLREELGLTLERYNELARITQRIMDQSADSQGLGRTSHVLLSIAGRKDLNDVEKATCIFMFACRVINVAGHISGMVVVPQRVELPELVSVVMATLLSLVEQMPKSEAQDFCRFASVSLAKMAEGGQC